MKEFQVGTGTYVISEKNNQKRSIQLFCLLCILIIFSVIKNGLLPFLSKQVGLSGLFFPILFVLSGMIMSLLVDLVLHQLLEPNKKINYFHSLNLGIIYTLVLPLYTPLLFVVLGAGIVIIFEYLIRKFFGKVYLPPVLIGWVFIMGLHLLSFIPTLDYLNPLEVELGTPLGMASTIPDLGSYHTVVKPYGSLLDFIFGFVPGGVGTTSILLCTILAIYLTIKKELKWRIPLVTIATVFGMTFMIGEFSHLSLWYPLFQICSGSFVFGSIFIAAYDETSPVTPIGQVLYGLFLGVLIVVLRYMTPLTDGSLTAMLILPIFNSVFDYIGAIARFHFTKSVIAFLIAWFLILFIACFIGIQNMKQEKMIDTSVVNIQLT